MEELASLRREQIKQEGEVVFLAIGDVDGTYKGKSENAARRVPVHSSLAGELLRRKDSDTSPLFFPVLETKRADGKLGDKFGKRFGRAKKRLGITGGRHKGLHSFRSHLITNIHRAGVSESEAVWITGHTKKRQSLAYDHYSRGPGLVRLADIFEAAMGYGLKEELGVLGSVALHFR